MAMEQGAQERLMVKQNALTTQMREDMNGAIDVLKDELNLDFILLYEEGGQIIFANTEYDITERMVTMLNENRETPTEEEITEVIEETADSASEE
jgi:Skp family chaperone for outer membrane proteins